MKNTILMILLISGLNANDVEINKEKCELGDSTACEKVAHAYEVGKGVKKHFGESVKYYKAACGKGSGKSCGRVGLTYETFDSGLSEKVSLQYSAVYYAKACELGEKIYCKGVGHWQEYLDNL